MNIKSIQLTRKGGEDDPLAEAVVDVELDDGRCFRIIRENLGGNFSHNVSTDRPTNRPSRKEHADALRDLVAALDSPPMVEDDNRYAAMENARDVVKREEHEPASYDDWESIEFCGAGDRRRDPGIHTECSNCGGRDGQHTPECKS